MEIAHVVLLDVGKSYELLTRYLDERLKNQGGAMMVEFTAENPISFNPFVMDGGLDLERKQTILSVIFTIYKEGLTEMEKDVLTHSVSDFFKNPGLERSFNEYYRFCKSYIPKLVKEQLLDFNSNEFLLYPGQILPGRGNTITY